MKAIVQRVRKASVSIDGKVISEIGPGLLTLLGVSATDTQADADWLIRKIISLRIFEDSGQKMNLSLKDVGGQHLIVSQFTLYGDASKGNRPSFIEAARPETAEPLYQYALATSRSLGVETFAGRFQATMLIALENDGPVTLVLESKKNPIPAPAAAL